MKNKYLIIGVLLTILTSAIIVEAQVLQTSMSGTAHWVTNGGIKRYSTNADLTVTMNGGNVNIEGPLYIYSKGNPVASFNLHLVGTKTGNNMVFNDTLSTATVLTTTTNELTPGETLYAPGWDGTLTKTGHIKLDGDIYRPPEKGYLDILLTLSGDTI